MNRIAVLSFLLGVCLASPGNGEMWKVGVAQVEITPQQPLMMSGYAARSQPAAETIAPLFCKAMVIQDANGRRVALITADLIGVGREFSRLVCNELRQRYGLKRDQIAICTSHTHTGPAIAGTLIPMYLPQASDDQKRAIHRYTTATQGKMVNAVHKAVSRLQPAVLKWGNGRVTFATNRRENRPADRVPAQRRSGTLKGPFDHDVPVLAVYDPTEERLRAVVFGYACHATVLSSVKWSGDYPGFAQQEIEEQFPGAVALFWAGCGGDQNPLPRRSVQLARHYGRQLAVAVEQVLLTTQLPTVAPTISTEYREIDLPFDAIPTHDDWKSQLSHKDAFVAARAQMMVDQFEKGTPPASTYPYPVATWKLGKQIEWVFLGGEVVVDFAIRLKSERHGPRTWVAGYTNDVMAYIPSRRVLAEGGYEGGGAMVYYGLPAPWDQPVEQMIVQEVHRQLDE